MQGIWSMNSTYTVSSFQSSCFEGATLPNSLSPSATTVQCIRILVSYRSSRLCCSWKHNVVCGTKQHYRNLEQVINGLYNNAVTSWSERRLIWLATAVCHQGAFLQKLSLFCIFFLLLFFVMEIAVTRTTIMQTHYPHLKGMGRLVSIWYDWHLKLIN